MYSSLGFTGVRGSLANYTYEVREVIVAKTEVFQQVVVFE
jgi:hypothetical protein